MAWYRLQATAIEPMKNSELPAGERGAFNVDARRSPTLPSRYYHDPRIHRQELDNIFHQSWCYVGHASQIPDPGDYRVERIADDGDNWYSESGLHRFHQLILAALDH
jgi:hypothetical protein